MSDHPVSLAAHYRASKIRSKGLRGCLIILVFLFFCPAFHTEAAEVRPVVIDYFFEAGCPDCLRVRDKIMPDLVEQFEGFYNLNEYDIGIKSNVIRLIA